MFMTCALVLGMMPLTLVGLRGEAHAAASYFRVDIITRDDYQVNGGDTYQATVNGETFVVYCNQIHSPDDPIGTFSISNGVAGTNRQNYLLKHGYPNTTTIGGVGFSAIDAQAATQIAMWLDDDPSVTFDDVVEINSRFGKPAPDHALFDAAKRLFAAANAYRGGDADIDEAAATYTSDTAGAQRVLTPDLTPRGNIAVVKASANTGVTNGNTCYDLSGARFEVRKSSGRLVGTIVTDSDGKGMLSNLRVGSYTVTEVGAPEGYRIDVAEKTTTVVADSTATVKFEDQPLLDTADTRVWKSDATLGETLPQGAASLAGAEFTFNFYAGYYANLGELPAQPTRTWVMRTNTQGEAKPFDGASARVQGGRFFTDSDGSIAIPLGTVTVTETKAPAGYLLDDGSGNAPKTYLSHIVADSSRPGGAGVEPVNYADGELAQAYNTPISPDLIMRGNVELAKTDSATLDGKAQGAATLAGAEYQIVNASPNVVVSPQTGERIGTGEVVCTIVTDADGHASTTAAELNGWSIPEDFYGKALAFGTYTIRESKPPEGYLLNTEWSATVEITADGQVVSVDTTDDVIRGDIEFSKVDGTTMGRLGNVPFLVTSKTNGEAHVAVTDENGMLSTASDWNAHTQATNANDMALVDDGDELTVNESMLDPSAGIWFFGHADASTGAPADDELGALPYDTYMVEELRCSANAGLALASFEVNVTRHARNLNLGTVDDNPGPAMGTTLVDGNDSQTVSAIGTTTLTDEVSYSGFAPGEYRFEGELHVIDENGEVGEVVATASKTVKLAAPSGVVDMLFDLEGAPYAGKSIVAFERAYDSSGEVVASHEDPTDTFQTVHVPEIGTTLTDAVDGDQEISANGPVTVTDTVSYAGLTPDKDYQMTMTLHRVADDGSDAGAALDADGNEITATSSFTPSSPDGTVEVTATFELPDQGGYSLVAFEELKHRGAVYAMHADISDQPQTVRVSGDEPKLGIGTMAADTKTRTHEGVAATSASIVDTVAYEGLNPGETYIVSGTLHDTATGKPFVQPNGTTVSATTEFTAEKAQGTVDVAFEFDGSNLGGKSVVAFEKLAKASEPDKAIAVHEDINSKKQTIAYKGVPAKTTATKGGGASPRTGDKLWGLAPLFLLAAITAAVTAIWARQRRKLEIKPTHPRHARRR